jgi:hypothetical protein
MVFKGRASCDEVNCSFVHDLHIRVLHSSFLVKQKASQFHVEKGWALEWFFDECHDKYFVMLIVFPVLNRNIGLEFVVSLKIRNPKHEIRNNAQ